MTLGRRKLALVGILMLILMSMEECASFALTRRSTCSMPIQGFPGSSSRNVALRRPTTKSRYNPSLRGFNTIDAENDPSPDEKDERTRGVLVLLTVPMAWGTFEPAVRYVYAVQPPIPGFVFSVGYYLVAAVSLAVLLLVASSSEANDDSSSQEPLVDDTSVAETSHAATAGISLPIRGGMELGTYLFLGNGLQVLGLKTVPSDRAAFLLQLTTIFVPLVQAVIAKDLLAVPLKTWCACWVALCGVAVIGLDQQGGTEDVAFSTFFSSFSNLSQGDILIILAAFSYTFHCIRLGRFAKETSALKLATAKATMETLWSLSLVSSLVALSHSDPSGGSLGSYLSEEGQDISNWIATFSHDISSGTLDSSVLLPALAAVLWTGWVTVAYTIYAQSFGQSRVNATDANLIYTVQPIFTALVAWGLLGETLGPTGYVGAALIFCAVTLVASSSEETHKDAGR